MANVWGDNFQYNGKQPDFTRQEYATFADMKAAKKNQMPELYIGYCLEDRNYYKYDKTNDDDEVLGRWRLWSGGGESIQKKALPTASETELGKIYQYTGITGTYTRGFFYECVAEEHTETVPIETAIDLKQLISDSGSTIQLKLTDESVIDVIGYEFNNIFYFVNEDIIYGGTKVDDVVTLADSTPYTTNEEIMSLGITKEVITYTYSWSNIDVSSGGGTIETITVEEVDELFD